MKLTDYVSYADAQRHCTTEALWALFDGDKQRLNIAHECIDRHAGDAARVAVRIAHADGRDEVLTFRQIADASARVAHDLEARGVARGDRVAIMLEPGLPFYAGLFGAMKRGAVAVPLFMLFGPDGLRLRLDDCKPRLLLTTADKAPIAAGIDELRTVICDDAWIAGLGRHPAEYAWESRADDLACLQYTSGTTRALPEAIQHTHRAVVLVMIAALYGTGIRPGDQFFCPSSPAWGHGMWHGTLAPLAMGVTTGAYSGRFSPERLLKALSDYKTTNLSAAATHYRMMRTCGAAEKYNYCFDKLSFTGEPIDSETAAYIARVFGKPVCSFYGTTEVGVILVSYPGAPDFAVKPGTLGKPIPNARVEVQGPDGKPVPPGQLGEIKLWRRNGWVPTKDLGSVDADGYFTHGGRADDVIISAGWTISAIEVEDAILKHPDVREAAAIGVPDATRGLVVKAFVVSDRSQDDAFVREIQDLVRTRLSQHEYPRVVAVVPALPKTPAGKVNRKVLREREAAVPRTAG